MSFASYSSTTAGNYRKGVKKDKHCCDAIKRREQMRNKLSEKLEELALQKEYEL